MRRRREGGEFRRDLRAKPVRPGQAAGHRPGRGGRSSSTPTSTAIRASRNFSSEYWKNARKRVMLVPSSGGGARSAAFDAARLASATLPERTAINTVIQGSAADLIKLAMIAIHRRLRSERLSARDAAADPRRIGLRSPARRNRTTCASWWPRKCPAVMPLRRALEGRHENRETIGRIARPGIRFRGGMPVRRTAHGDASKIPLGGNRGRNRQRQELGRRTVRSGTAPW